ncbi:extracellular superoxide dismutase [Cu-Zn] [Sorex araneus]|uniref:extracellular superoxide dismutase [Cu-Zn] n=1 Tax=Sorex araneus TaxID=42254 RepID=UPI0024337172|nr:extracellular superoxide dismutase [Cu-Zn] [Sorex araneus]
MLALLCACLLARARLGAPTEPAGLGGNGTAERIRDMHAKVTELWRAMQSRCACRPDAAAGAPLFACCAVQPSASLGASEQPRVAGLVLFRQGAPGPGSSLEAFFDLNGFPAQPNTSLRAIHVHQLGDVSRGCDATQGHYDPLSAPHPQHPGDFGNFVVRRGRLSAHRSRLSAQLAGPHSILGRSLVVHEGEDDLGRGGNEASRKHGNAGRRLACCTISLCDPELWERRAQEHSQRLRSKKDKSECKSP